MSSPGEDSALLGAHQQPDDLMDVPLDNSTEMPAERPAEPEGGTGLAASRPSVSLLPDSALQSMCLRPGLRVHVTAPAQASKTSSLGLPTTFTTYLIETTTTLPEYPAAPIAVRRRFSEFDSPRPLQHLQHGGIERSGSAHGLTSTFSMAA